MSTKAPTKAPTSFLIPADQLPWGAWYTLALIIIGAVLLAKNIMPADMVFLGIDAMLILAQIITLNEGIAGFAQSGLLTVGILMVATYGITQTGGLGYFSNKILGVPKHTGSALIRILSLAGLISSFVNDTPTFLLLLPVVAAWTAKLGLDVRTVILPMSFTVLLSGTNTLIGTSTNLAVAGEFAKVYPTLVLEFFGITTAGIPVFFWGLSYVLLFSEVLLPSKLKTTPATELKQAQQQADSVQLRARVVEDTSVGKTIEGAGLRGLKVLYLYSVRRADKVFPAVKPDFVLEKGDELLFTGSPDRFVQVCAESGLAPINSDQDTENPSVVQGHVVMAMVRDQASIIGLTPKDAHFRSRFGASIIGIQRSGQKIDGEFGQIQFKVGDVLALLTDDKFDPFSAETGKELKVLDLKPSAEVGDGYLISAVVSANSKIQFAVRLGGKTVDQAKLRGLHEAYLVAIVRADTKEIIRNPDPTVVLNTGDTLWFTGSGLGVVKTVRQIPGLELTSETQAQKIPTQFYVDRKLVEVVIGPKSFLVGSTAREVRFRTRFGAAVVAIRHGAGSSDDTLGMSISDTTFRVGDILLLDASPDFIKTHGSDANNFLVVNTVLESSPVQFRKFYISIFLFIAIFVIFIATSTTVSLIPLGLIINGIMLAIGVMTPTQARAAIYWDVLFTIAAASGLSTALTKTNLAKAIGGAFVQLSISTGGGVTGVIAALYIATMLISLLVANNAAAIIMFSIGVQIQKLYPALDPLTMTYTTMLAASASFLIPYGYQTNILSLSLGPYTTLEAVKFGFPLQMILIPVSILALADMRDNWYAHVFISVAVFLLTVGIKLFFLKGRKLLDKSRKDSGDLKTDGTVIAVDDDGKKDGI